MRFLLCKDIIYIIHNGYEHETAVNTEQELRQMLVQKGYKIVRLNMEVDNDYERACELEKQEQCKEVYPYNLI